MRKNDKLSSSALGVGYVSVMIIFAVICLTIFAVMSFSAASSSDGFNERSGSYLQRYYTADSAAKRRLAALDAIAVNAAETGFFEDEFVSLFNTAAKSGYEDFDEETFEGIALDRTADGFSALWTEKLGNGQVLSVEVDFNNEGKYEIISWQSRTLSEESSDSHIGVWDGSF